MKDKKYISLKEIGTELPFSVPENYFEDFAANMEAQITIKPIPMRKAFAPWMYMAAMFVGVLVLGQIMFSVLRDNTSKNDDNYESYVLSQVDESSLMDLYVDNSDVK